MKLTKLILAHAVLLPLVMAGSLHTCTKTSEDSHVPAYVKKEREEIQRLYQEALKEGGLVNVFAGGDLQDAGADIVKIFECQFPGMKLKIKTDLSKYHNTLIDKQLALGKEALEPDVAHLQTLQDFYRWKSKGELLQYKPVSFPHIYNDYKDADGYFWATHIYYFTNVVSSSIPKAQRPVEAADYLRPEFGDGKIVYTYPHDDDAVLYQFMRLVEQNGLDWLQAFVDQKPLAVRGTATPVYYIHNGTSLATFTSKGSLKFMPGAHSITILPKTTFFQSWAQLGAIFKKAKHPAAAKLYVSWLTSYDVQKVVMANTWSQRTDIPPPPGTDHIWNVPNTDPLGFRDYMLNRTKVHEDQAFIEKFVGPIVGPSPLQLKYT